MSDGKDSRLARWSRRKLAARHDEKEPGELPAKAYPDGSLPLPDADMPEGVEPETAEPPQPLPRLEDLTADSDLTAFLKKGVPMALKSAALRKMWSIDPGIRDYVGPAEYAWDFNQPGSMAGFGPLDPGRSVVSFLSKTVRALGEDAEQTVFTQPPDAPSDESASTQPDAEAAVETPSVVPPAQQPAVRVPVILADNTSTEAPDQPTMATVPAPESARWPDLEPLPRPRHGGAMPR
ncbi:DUF3306 domain-containing protein [Mesorhizobium sp. CAU 1732]|uniref:DUF3306 domain-containing protein n=1 Tax=Mesorhizobium sp. CAU 1732 TaxID=3140358 RepID=UPI0032600547